MRAGELDRKIRIETRSVSQQTYGEAIITYTLLAEVWAKVRPASAREIFDADQVIAEQFMVFVVYWLAGIDAQGRIVYDGNNYNIVAVNEIGRREGLRITARVVNP